MIFSAIRNWLKQKADDEPELQPFVPIVKDGKAKILDHEQIPELHVEISSKDDGRNGIGIERYLGISSGVVYTVVNPWELDD